MQICSLLPSGTEILYALGLGPSVVGVTHECDYPADAATKPALIQPRVDPHAPPAEIDRQVAALVARGESIYSVNAGLLESLAPDLIVTQDLCHVCAASPDDLASALSRFSKSPRVLSLVPHSLADVWDDIRRVGEATGTQPAAESLAASLAQRVAAVESRSSSLHPRPRVLCLEWLDPFYIGGHWVPEMVAKAGGEDVLGIPREPSRRVTLEEIAASGPDVILVMQCGYTAARNSADFSKMCLRETFKGFPAVRHNRIFAVDANSYFSRPGPRLADGLELLAHILHPSHFPCANLREAFLRI
ncbi:MAG TPA: cobalamin-binding protein [Verrucomicrobiae bacterium]|nr:cobalamin-binding protein [Verrucomicrobiae bacterium]